MMHTFSTMKHSDEMKKFFEDRRSDNSTITIFEAFDKGFEAAEKSPKINPRSTTIEYHKLDNERQVFFYEQDFYVFSNFSAFTLKWRGNLFKTSEEAYHWEKFPHNKELQDAIMSSSSAHKVFNLAKKFKDECRSDWGDIKVRVMSDILKAKLEQHEYVRQKLIATGDRELIEDSWRDDFWGWGPNKDGKNMLGKLWMEIRRELS